MKKGNLGGAVVRRIKLRYVSPTNFEGKPVIHLNLKNFELVYMRYEKMVVGGFVG